MRRVEIKSHVERFFKDKDGHWAIMQFPNVPLAVWLALVVVNLFLHSQQVGHLQSGVLLVWAYLEITEGTSRFRKALGVVAAALSVASFLG